MGRQGNLIIRFLTDSKKVLLDDVVDTLKNNISLVYDFLFE